MAQPIVLPPHIKSIHGRFDKKDDLLFYTRYGKTFPKRLPYCSPTPTAAQKTCREIFKEANTLASSDMHDKNKKLHWRTIAAQSNGKYSSAHGAALAHHYAEIKKQITTTELAQTNIEVLPSIAHLRSENYKPRANRQHNNAPIVLKHKDRTPIYHHSTSRKRLIINTWNRESG